MGAGLTRFTAFTRRHALALWLVCVVGAVFVTARTHYVADLSAFLPSAPTAEQAVLLDQLRSGVAARLVLVGIEGGTLKARTGASLQLAAALRKSGAFESVHNGDNSQFEATGKFLFDHRYLLSPAVDAQRFTAEGIRTAIDETTSLLGTPAGSMIKPLILRDPTGETVRMAETMLPTQSPRSEGGVWVSRNAERAVLLATTRADGADLDAQEHSLQLVRTSFAPLEAQGLRLIVSGAGTFAVSSRTQIKSEVERLAIAGGVAIVGLMLVAFGGSLRTLFTATLPVASGVLAGITLVSLTFGNVHGITLGFGTTLIGEAVDYAIYYLIQARTVAGGAAGSGSQRWLLDNWPTVRLGLLTSLCGFAALVFSGFPGLAQLGVFSIAGLTAAALTTRCVFPVLVPDGAPGMGLRRHLGHFTGAAAALLPRVRWPLVALTLVAAAALAWLPSAWRGDLSSLNPVGAAAMQIDADLRADLGASDASTLVAVSAHDEAGALAGAEAAGARLDKLVADGVLQGYESPARLLPSPATQSARRAALPEPKLLAERLAEATVDGPLSAPRLGAFLADVESARAQPLLDRTALRSTPLASALDAMLVPGEGGRPWRALLSLQGGASATAIDVPRLRQALAGVPGAQVVNIKAELDALYARYLHEAILQALLGALAVCVLLGLHQRSLARLVRVALPVAGALLIVLAGLTFAGVTLGILHLVGLLLMVAIGSNYALFFDQIRVDFEHTGRHADNDTLASLALANLTAVISFCLLALSNIPALRAIGQVVAPGILLSLLLAAAFIPTRRPGSYGKIAPPL
ncbi:MAG: MMPL family transporter [Burkholderiales bacterium]